MSDLPWPFDYIDAVFAKRWPRLRKALYERIAERYQGQIDTGHGNISMRRGWTFGAVTIWLDEWD